MGTNLNGCMLRATPHRLYGEWLQWCAPPPPRATPPDIHVFIHVCNIGKWDEVLRELMDHVQKSGLYNACAGLYYGSSCPNCAPPNPRLLHCQRCQHPPKKKIEWGIDLGGLHGCI